MNIELTEKFLKEIHVPADLISQLKQEEVDEARYKESIEAYTKSRLEYFKTTAGEEIRKGAAKTSGIKALIKSKKDLSRLMGMTYSDKDIQDKDYAELLDEAKIALATKLQEASQSDTAGYVQQINDLQTNLAQLAEEKEQLESSKAAFEQETKDKYEGLFKLGEAKRKYAEFVSKEELVDDPHLKGMKSLALKAIEDEIFNSGNYIIGDDMQLLNTDRTIAKHPDKDTIVESAYELFKYRATQAGLYKVSNGGQTSTDQPATFKDANGNQKVNNGGVSQAEQEMLAKFQESRKVKF